ncbi:MAG: type II toxin-antitoxin system VapC family toxin [Chloroflexota bacterium]
MRGFHQLDQGRTMLIVPLPIVLEVYKWLLQRAGLRLARMGLSLLRERVEIVHLAQPDFEASLQLLFVHAEWLGTIEDAVVAQTALRLDAPVWTYNYRDLNAFPNLHFWTPA